MKRVLALWLPNWPIQRLLNSRPELAGRPVLLEAPSRRGRSIAACSAEAQAAGVCVGMPTAEAITIITLANHSLLAPAFTPGSNEPPTSSAEKNVSHPSELNQGRNKPRANSASANRRSNSTAASAGIKESTFHPAVNDGAKWELHRHDPLADRQSLRRLAQWCHRYTPTAGVEETDHPETLLLDATNLAPLYGSEAALVAQVLHGLRRLGFEVRAALASTIGAAWALAHYGQQGQAPATPWEGEAPAEPRTGYTAQRLGRSLALPNNETAALAALPIAALRLSDELLETLHNLGAERTGDLLALPREQLRSRFGPELLNRIDQALGSTGEVFAAVDPPEEFVVEQLFEFPLSDRAALEHVVGSLLERLAWMLAARCAGALCLRCRFDCEGAAAAELEVGLFQPSANPRHMREIVELEMERFRLPAPAAAVSVRAVRHAPLEQRQAVLFDEKRNLDSSYPLAALVDRLAGRLGRRAVVRCRLQRDAQPELAYAKESLISDPPPLKGWEQPSTGNPKLPERRAVVRREATRGGIYRFSKRSPARSKRSSKNPSPNLSPQGRGTFGPLDRPLYLLRRPAPLETLSVVPDGPPIQFRRNGRRHQIVRHWGPERIETGWWRGQSAWRDYYRVETSEGRRYWLFRRRDGRWFLHGIFG